MEKIKQLYHPYKQLIPVLILLFYGIDLLYTYFTGQFEFNGKMVKFFSGIEQHAALNAIVLNFMVFFLARPYYRYILIATIISGLFGWLNFRPYQSTIDLKLGGLHTEFHTQMILPCIAVFIINSNRLFPHVGATPEVSVKPATWDEDIVRFRSAFERYTTENLYTVMNDKRYTGAAVEAARQLLEEKGVSPPEIPDQPEPLK